VIGDNTLITLFILCRELVKQVGKSGAPGRIPVLLSSWATSAYGETGSK